MTTHPLTKPIEYFEKRFWKFVNHSSDCWMWTGNKNRSDYGMFYILGKYVVAHRYSYQELVGEVPKGLYLDHLCRNRLCVNPRHLEPVTMRENIMRGEGIASKNARKTYCKYGHPLFGENLRKLVLKTRREMRICIACQNRRNGFRKKGND